jgi:hypothetical protein
MFIRPVEGSPLRYMASGAARVDFRFLVFHQLGASGSMYKMTGSAAHLILSVPASYAAALGVLVQVAGKTGTIGFNRRQFGRILDIVGGSRFGVFGARAVTGLAGVLIPALPRAGLDCKMRSFL